MSKEIDPASRAQYITPPQLKFLEELLIDVGLSSTKPRNDFLSREAGRDIVYPTQLTKTEAMGIISDLQELRDRKRNEAQFGRS